MIERDTSPPRPASGGVGPATGPSPLVESGPGRGWPCAAMAIFDWSAGPVWFAAGLAFGALLALAWSPRRSRRRLAEERGRVGRLHDRYRLLAEHARDIVLFVRPDGRIVEANHAAVVAYGHDRDAFLGLKITDLREQSTAPSIPEQLARADAEGMTFETVHRRKDGS